MKITISGVAGAGKGTVGKDLAKALSLNFVSTGDMFRSLAKSQGISIYELHERAEKDPEIDKKIDKETENYGKKNKDFIFDARLAWFWIPDSFKVFLYCQNDVRFERISKRDRISIEEARDLTMSRENIMLRQYRTLYNIGNYIDFLHYDLIIDTTNLSPKEIVKKIVEECSK